MKVLVVGAGTMGRWLVDVLQDDGFEDVDVTVTDRDVVTAEATAADLGARAVPTDATEPVDLVCVAVPISAARAAIEAHGDLAGQAIVDVTGTMREPIEAMRTVAPARERASLHPLFAPGNEPGNVPTVIDESGPIVRALESALSDRGNTVFRTDPDTHDDAMETVQARTHTAVLAFALATDEVETPFHTPISRGLQSLVDQVTDGEATVYAEIQDAFEGSGDVAAAARRIADADAEAFVDLYDEVSE